MAGWVLEPPRPTGPIQDSALWCLCPAVPLSVATLAGLEEVGHVQLFCDYPFTAYMILTVWKLLTIEL